MMNGEKVYWNKEVAELLQVGDSTLRKWCILLEERGHSFLKDEHQRRGFRDADVVLLRRFRDLAKQNGMTLENAANAVLSRDEGVLRTTLVPEKQTERGSFDVNDFHEYMERQVEFNQALLERLDAQQEHYEALLHKQQAYIENSIRVRDERLIQAIRDIQETRLQLGASQEEPKRSLWQRLFGRSK